MRISDLGFFFALEIKNCTLAELIEAVTSPAPTHQTLFVFLLTYRSICKPHELVDHIINRFEDCKDDPKASVIRLRCINFFRTWIDKNWFDFSKVRASNLLSSQLCSLNWSLVGSGRVEAED